MVVKFFNGKETDNSISGVFLVLFMTFHACMNFVAVINLGAYDAVCKFWVPTGTLLSVQQCWQVDS